MFVLLKKEVSTFLTSLIGYVVIVVFLLINGLFLWVFHVESNILDWGYANLDGLFIQAPFVFLFLIPAITMRLFADEKRSGTLETLITRPLTELQIVMAKYLSGLLLVLIALLPTLIYLLTVYLLALPAGNIDTGGIWGSYIGLFFLGASFVAIGLFASSLTDNQIVAFILGALLCAGVYTGFELIYSMELFGYIDFFLRQLGINAHYSAMSRGVIDTRDALYFISLITLFVMLTKISLESRKW
ncbi:MAG: gliding motility-associated ABC transporter permease subunit GldF [Bacteroidales bacterium]|nr:gliding motility-associated ABC transporter permease subunit GldF [Bacteroidales bacterium]